MGASSNLEEVLKGTNSETAINQAQKISFTFNNDNAKNDSPSKYEQRPQPTVVMQSSIDEDINSLRPETLFEPKPPSKREQINYSLESNSYKYSQPAPQVFNSAMNGTLQSGAYTNTITNLSSNISNTSSELFHSFGNTNKPQAYQSYEYEEEEVAYYQSGNQVDYYRRDYEQVEYGNASDEVNEVKLERTADFPKARTNQSKLSYR